MVAKFLDDNKFLICQILAKFSGFNPTGRYQSLEKGKGTSLVWMKKDIFRLSIFFTTLLMLTSMFKTSS